MSWNISKRKTLVRREKQSAFWNKNPRIVRNINKIIRFNYSKNRIRLTLLIPPRPKTPTLILPIYRIFHRRDDLLWASSNLCGDIACDTVSDSGHCRLLKCVRNAVLYPLVERAKSKVLCVTSEPDFSVIVTFAISTQNLHVEVPFLP